MKTFMQNKVWIHGPAFLLKPKSEWPKQPDEKDSTTEGDPEVKTCARVFITSTTESLHFQQSCCFLLSLATTKEGSRMASQTERDTNTTKRQEKGAQSFYQSKVKSIIQQHMLSLEELARAETELIQQSQVHEFLEEICALQERAQTKKKSQLYRLDPMLQDGILRVGGRLNKTAMPQQAKHPAFLSKQSPIANLILQHIHQEGGHCGHNYMLSALHISIV